MELPYHVQPSPPSPAVDIPATIPTNDNNIPPTNYVPNFNFPVGYRFRPTDDELIRYYLEKKVMNQKLPPHEIPEENLYRHNPEDLSAKYKMIGEKEWYFFTSRSRKYPNGNRPNRAVGSAEPGIVNGYWKATGSDREIKYGSNIIGFKKTLVFYEGKPPKGLKTKWIMQEFRVNDAQPGGTTIKENDGDNMRLDKCVLCKIYKNVDNSIREDARQNEDLELNTQHGQSIAPNNNVVTVTNSDQATNEDLSSVQTMPPNDRAIDGGTAVYEFGSGSLIQTAKPISYPSYSSTNANQPIIWGGGPFSLPKTPSPLNFYYDANTLNEIYNNDGYNLWTWGPLN
ncbi:unnamed protein product [Cuscuta europaea]|uniref:NAC domain-containing protein n=1 Tax=Cuscuta europaea TaxID=41803 RepID=A0A9P0Z4Q9_CUSEU|nr:unnamed protein product [Cuscuta europaea]